MVVLTCRSGAEKYLEGVPAKVGAPSFPSVPIPIAFQIAFHKQRREIYFSQKSYKNPSKSDDFEGFDMEQGTGIEPASSAWEADVLPMY